MSNHSGSHRQEGKDPSQDHFKEAKPDSVGANEAKPTMLRRIATLWLISSKTRPTAAARRIGGVRGQLYCMASGVSGRG